jgi:hypothetical protein
MKKTADHSLLIILVALLCISLTVHAESTAESTQRIDDIVRRDLQKHKQTPNARVDDTQFVRRVYLDVIGRIPTASELAAFHTSADEDRRARLIDELLASDGHISHMYNWLGDMLRVKDEYYRIGKTYTFQTWLKDQLRENRPWDEIVYELLTAEGRLGENGATAWLLRDASMPLDSLSNTLTTFLGANVACAQCHDHPFAEWTQRDFYEMASFFGATAFERIDARKPAKKMADDRFSKANLVTLLRINIERVEYDKNRATLFPEDYAYDDASPGDKVTPKFIKWNDSEKTTSITGKPQHRRKQFANWMISPENPRFAAAIANRLWKMYFGVAVNEPVTDLDVLEDATNSELLKHLAQVMKDVDFDIRAFQRILLNTKTYQQQASLTPAEGEEYRFPGPLLRRMTAEQVWDSLVLMLRGPQIDRLQVDNAPKMTRLLFPDDIPLDNAGILREKEKIFAFAKSILNERAPSDAKTGGRGLFMRAPKYRGNSTWLRASELTQPMPPTHFLRLAGQSARDVADDGSVEGGITGSLAFMNGEYTKLLMSNSASVMKTLGEIKSDEKKIVFLYETFLSRQSTVEELERVASALEDGLELKDVVWALVNSREFLFIQ